jgi:hypothetical protein
MRLRLTGRIVAIVQDPKPIGNLEDMYIVIEKEKGDDKVFLVPANGLSVTSSRASCTIQVMEANTFVEELIKGTIKQIGKASFDDVMGLTMEDKS